jgi:predicted lipoprotein with Yx(FWY)xxD motif
MTALVLLAVSCLLVSCSGGPAARVSTHGTVPRGTVVLYAMHTNLGQVVTLPYGSPVYVNTNDDGSSRASCTGSCTKHWVPVLTAQAPKATAGVQSSQVGTTQYGSYEQVTYFGHRLYYDKSDTHPLVASGQGTAGTWYVILPNGQVLQ